jgi:hypothetical protein
LSTGFFRGPLFVISLYTTRIGSLTQHAIFCPLSFSFLLHSSYFRPFHQITFYLIGGKEPVLACCTAANIFSSADEKSPFLQSEEEILQSLVFVNNRFLSRPTLFVISLYT